MTASWSPPAPGPCVLGVSLRIPLTLGHVLVLDEEGSPIVHGGPIEPGDLALAVFVCRQPADAARKDLASWWMPLLMRWWGRRNGKVDWESQVAAFAEWFTESAKAPLAISRSGSSGRGMAAPWWVNRMATAMHSLGLSYAETVSLPAKRIAQLVMASAEAEGRVELWTDRDQSFWDTCQRLDREREQAG